MNPPHQLQLLPVVGFEAIHGPVFEYVGELWFEVVLVHLVVDAVLDGHGILY